MDDILFGDLVITFLNLVEGEDSLYSFWVELDTKTGIAMWQLLVLFSFCPVQPSLQLFLLGKMVGRHKETHESIFVAEHPLLCNKGWLSMKCMASFFC